jgi:PKD repeat protein
MNTILPSPQSAPLGGYPARRVETSSLRKKLPMKFSPSVLLAFTALSFFAGSEARADNMASIAIAPASGAVTLVPRWTIGGNLGGFRHMAQDLSLGGGANQFYSLKGTAIPSGGDITAFSLYIAGTGAKTDHADIGSKLRPNSYSALASADPDLGFGSVQLYFVHHKTDGDYFSHLVPSSGTASAVTDLKPMSGPGGPATGGASGYFGLTFAAANLGYGLNMFYYLRTDPVTNTTKFGTMVPSLAGASADKFDLGITGHSALEFSSIDLGYGVNKMYYQRLDPITGFTILGTLDPLTGRAADIANLGSVYSTLAFVPGDVGFGSNKLYTTGAVNATWQSVSFAAIADRLISAGSFAVTPSASSTLPIVLTVVVGSTGAASISGPVAGVYTVTPTAPGLITLQATQAGQPGTFEFNMLRQSFTATGSASLAITTQPASHGASSGSTTTFSVAASGSSTVSYQWRKGGINISTANASATTATLFLPNVQAADAATYDVAVTNLSGTILSDTVTLTVTTAAPVITNSSLSSAATVGTPFNFMITATNSPTTYSASPLPAGLTFNPASGILSGTPTTVGTTVVSLGATNATGTATATLTITTTAAAGTPVITSPPSAPGTVGAPFVTYLIAATGQPTSYTATGLPPGLTLNPLTGAITGTPAAAGTFTVTLTATNSVGTTTATLVITVGASGTAPVITSPTTAPGTMGAPFVTYLIAATGLPTSYTATGLPAGLTLNPLTGAITGTPTVAGTFTVTLTATNSAGTSTATLVITIAAAGTAPVITSPTTAPGTRGTPFVTYLIAATGLPTSYTATGLPAGLTLNPLTGAITGTPTVAGTFTVTLTATNASGTTTATLTLTIAATPTSRIVNFSARALSGPGAQSLIMGFVVQGDNKNLLVRGIGPGLAPYGVVNVLTDPFLTLFNNNSTLASNDDWQSSNGTLIAATAARVGAFALPNGSKDSALILAFNNGAHTTSMLRPNGTTGVALTEIYDIDSTADSRLINVSARMNVTTGEGTLIAGLVIAGNAPTTVLIRGIGPTLAAFGVTGALADPTITVFAGTNPVATNDNWEAGGVGAAQITATSVRVGAFALLPGSKDAALLITLQPGAYTVQVTGVANTTGVALVEVYDAN